MTKLDLTKQYKSYYTAKTKPELVDIEPAQYLSIPGKGDPSGEEFSGNIGALYTVAYVIKFICKAGGKDFTVAKLEGLWWYDEARYFDATIEHAPTLIPRSEWYYRLLIRLPEYVNAAHIAMGITTAIEKKKVAAAEHVELYLMPAHKAAQMLHNGPFDKEPETLAQIMSFMQENKLPKNGLHHEIYLSDFRKTAPDKLKTILREPTI